MLRRRRNELGASLLVTLAVLAGACSGDDGADGDAVDDTPSTTSVEDTVRLDELQVIGSHNSYHLAPEDPVLDAIAGFTPELAAEIDYTHRPLTEQLEEHGIRQFELDVYADPEGGRFATRPALELVGLPVESGEPALDEPGFKVLHIADVDFRTTCLTFVACLTEIEEWSTADPDHEPVMIMVEAKSTSVVEDAAALGVDVTELPVDFTEVLPFSADLFDDLDAEITSVFDRDRIITPDDMRGDAATLEAAVLTGEAWPTLADARGKVMFSLVDAGVNRDLYVGDTPSLEGRVMFTSSEEGRPDAAFIRVDDPREADRIEALVQAGYLVRTRSDVPGVDAVQGDTTRRDAALASGAQFVSTDYYVEDPELDTGYVVELPGRDAIRCSPIRSGCPL